MKTILAALSAILALTAFAGEAAAGPRDGYRASEIIVIDDHYDRDYRRDRRDDRDYRRSDYGDVISERRIVRRLIRQGFVSVEDIRLRRDRYIVEAIRPNGALVRLAIDAYDGQIIARERIGWARDGGRRGPRGGYHDPAGIEFDFGGGRLGIYGR